MHDISYEDRYIITRVNTGKVGRWAMPPSIPDRCYYCPSDNEAVTHKKREGVYYGICAECLAKSKKR